MPFDELPNGEGWIAAALPSALYLVSQLDRQRVEMWKTALRRGTLEWQLWAEAVWKRADGARFASGTAQFRRQRASGCKKCLRPRLRVISDGYGSAQWLSTLVISPVLPSSAP
jgi:hypothetical protein